MGRRLSTPIHSIASSNSFTSTLPPQSWHNTAFIDARQLGVAHHGCHLPKTVSCQQRVGYRDGDFAIRLFHTDHGLADTINIFLPPTPPQFPIAHTTFEVAPYSHHTSPFLSSSTFTSTSLLLSHIASTLIGTLSYVITSLTSFLLPMASQLQRTGETLLAAFLLLSLIQAMVAQYQYQYDERGQLIFPDGLTLGTEDYYTDDSLFSSDDGQRIKQLEEEMLKPKSYVTIESPTGTSPDNTNLSWLTRIVKKLNKNLVLLLPWLTKTVHNILTRNTHLFHIGFIIFVLDSLLPFIMDRGDDELASDSILNIRDSSLLQKIDYHINSKEHPSPSTSTNPGPLRVLVIGDSLSIGIGCIEQFDATKDNSVPMALIQNTELPPLPISPEKTSLQYPHPRQGPVFPQALARTLSYHFHQPVQWRSAGVDGGDINDIRSFCMDVVKEECDTKKGSTVDIIVVLFGMNDLKKLMSTNPMQHLFRSSSRSEDATESGTITSRFRHGMEALLSDVRSCAPNALVVFPAMPIQPFNKNSIINIFPLGLMVDAVLGVWERQKQIVASNSRGNTLFLELKTKDIADWYSSISGKYGNAVNGIAGDHDEFRVIADFDDEFKDDVLLSADGVHPNKRMYAKWGELVGHQLYNRIVPQIELAEESHERVSSERERIHSRRRKLIG